MPRPRGYPTPDTPSEITMTTRCVTIPDIPEFIALIAGMLYPATFPSYWQEEGTMTAQEASELMADALALYDAESECAMTDGVPVGCVMWYPFDTIPDKWLKCLGQTISSDDYPELVALAGTTLPYLGQRFLFGADSDDDLLDTAGQESITIIESNLPEHTHTTPNHAQSYIASDGIGLLTNRAVRGNNTNAGTNSSGTNSGSGVTGVGNGTSVPINTMPPFMFGYWIIKALP